jgi:chorismate mutase / prephenate dehydratase
MAPMSADLEDLRRRLDEIDDRLQDLLIERFEIVLQVGAEKRGGSVAPHQPAREAEIIRRLIARNRGALQDETLVRIWRELLCGTTRLQGNFRVAVYAPAEAPGLWDIARDHYGSHSAMQAHPSVGAVIRAVAEGQAEIGVLPMPEEEELDPWWLLLLSPDRNTPRVVSRLPFGVRGNARAGRGDALAIGRSVPQSTGRDRTLFVAEIAPDISRGRIFSLLSSVGLETTFLAFCDRTGGSDALVEFRGSVLESDPRLDRFRTQLGGELYRLREFGGYAEPPQLDASARPAAESVGARG